MTTITEQDIIRTTFCFEFAAVAILELRHETKLAVRELFAEAREGLASCATVEEATAFHAKAEDFRAECRQVDDHEIEKFAVRIKLMAIRRIRQLSKES